MDIKKITQSQYLAALEMLKQAIVTCPESVWDDPADKFRFWDIAYHTLFFVHLYLQDVEADFVPWEKHQDEDTERTPYTKEDILVYVGLVQDQITQRVPALDLEAESGFHWLPFTKLELQFYNIRHIQQHTGELYERLGSRVQAELHWVGKQP